MRHLISQSEEDGREAEDEALASGVKDLQRLDLAGCCSGEKEDEDGAVMCLFCRYTSHGSLAHSQVCTHMTAQHCFDLSDVVSGLPFYTQVKLINYIRWKVCHNTIQ